MRSKLTTFIFIGMLGGIAVGYACNMLWPDPRPPSPFPAISA